VTRALLTPVFIAMAIAVIVAFVVVVLVRGGASTTPPAATGSPTPTNASSSPAFPTSSAPPVAVHWSSVVPTLSCGGVGTVVDARVISDLNGDGRPDAVISAHCDAGAGSPPSVVEVFLDVSGRPRPLGDVVAIKEDLLVERVGVRRGVITVNAQGYTAGTARCCPDRTVNERWRVETTAAMSRLVRLH
jgi:hypothetical protein